MIKINRQQEAPAILTTQGTTARQALEARWDGGERKFSKADFDSKIYGDTTVRKTLDPNDNPKCWYCEQRPNETGYVEVEHYRPKAEVVRTSPGKIAPGYYWLAYEWTNLANSCSRCNKLKGKKFPLEAGSSISESHHHDLSRERPLLIDPSRKDPADHIEWREEFPIPKAGCPLGQKTIEVFELDTRTPLLEARRRILKAMWFAFNQLPDPTAKRFLEACVKDDAYFTSMARAALGSWENGERPSFT